MGYYHRGSCRGPWPPSPHGPGGARAAVLHTWTTSALPLPCRVSFGYFPQLPALSGVPQFNMGDPAIIWRVAIRIRTTAHRFTSSALLPPRHQRNRFNLNSRFCRQCANMIKRMMASVREFVCYFHIRLRLDMEANLNLDLERTVEYMRRKFEHLRVGGDHHVPIPSNWSLQFTVECDHAVRVIWQAFNNSRRCTGISWDAKIILPYRPDVLGH